VSVRTAMDHVFEILSGALSVEIIYIRCVHLDSNSRGLLSAHALLSVRYAQSLRYQLRITIPIDAVAHALSQNKTYSSLWFFFCNYRLFWIRRELSSIMDVFPARA
jgi:hypothetical protein